MASVFRSQCIRGLIIFMFGSVALVIGYYGVSILVAAIGAHGSPGGDVLLLVFGLILLILCPVTFIIGVLFWTPSLPDSEDKNG
jgi:hypothetical protein